MPSTGGVVYSTIISMRPIDVIPTSRQLSAGITTTTNVPDDREIFKVDLFLYKNRLNIDLNIFQLSSRHYTIA